MRTDVMTRNGIRRLGRVRAGCCGVIAVILCWASAPALAAPKVVASIKPVHSLIAGVMEGVGEPRLLVKGGGSPHTYSLRPSEARLLREADIVFWVGEGMENFLVKPLKALAGKATVVELAEAMGIELLAAREGGAWEGHAHEDHGHDEEEHARDKHDEHAHEDHAKHEDHDEHEHEEHAGGGNNMHIWLDPHIAKRIVTAAVADLSRQDPANAARYESNGAALEARLDALDADLTAALKTVKNVPYVVFHDAYQYFEARYGLNAVGSITVSPGQVPGARRLYEIRKKILESKAACVFSEPQFQPALVDTVLEGTPANTAALDPLGAELPPGPGAYDQLLRNLAGSLRGCLATAS